MTVTNGEYANENTFNQSFMSREVDTSTVGKIDLLNAETESGPDVLNAQRLLNALASLIGVDPSTQTYNDVVDWANASVGSMNSDLIDKVEALVEKFFDTTGAGGHAHTGVDGDGPKVSATSLADYNDFWVALGSFDKAGVSGSSVNVTVDLVAHPSGGGPSTVGIITDPPGNKVQLVDAATRTNFEDAQGQRVYGRITYSLGAWVLYFYTNEAGVETAYSFPGSVDISVLYREVFQSADRPTVGANFADWGTLDLTADVVDASPTQRGLMSTGTQSFSGLKTFEDGVAFKDYIATERENVASAASITALSSAKSFVKLTGTTATTLRGVTAGVDGQRLVFHNATNQDAVLSNEDGAATAANRLALANGDNLTIIPNGSVELIYDTHISRWVQASGAGRNIIGYQEALGGTVNGVNPTFGPLSVEPVSDESIWVVVDGLIIEKEGWSLSGLSIVFESGHIPQTGQSVYVLYLGSGTPTTPVAPTGTEHVTYYTLSAGDITAKEVTLVATPSTPANVMLDVIGGTSQEYNVDFAVAGTSLTWNGLALDGTLEAGDKLRVHFFS